jgi:hypothetical protein
MDVSSLKQVISEDRISTDSEMLQTYGRDWTKYIEVKPRAVVFPTSTGEVVKLVEWARATKVALVPSGGRTGLSGAAIASSGEVVVSFEKMNKILQFNPVDMTLAVEPAQLPKTFKIAPKTKIFCSLWILLRAALVKLAETSQRMREASKWFVLA